MRGAPAFLLAFAVIPLAALAPVACSDDAVTAAPCTDIPPGGCPIARGVACEDPACAAVYACLPGNVWELRTTCPPREAGAAPREASAPDVDVPPVFDASFDAPPGSFGGPGCPSLAAPDCPLGVALACGAGCCGCEDLFVCSAGGWDLWGTCGDRGPVPVP